MAAGFKSQSSYGCLIFKSVMLHLLVLPVNWFSTIADLLFGSFIIVYQKGDIVMEPMISRDVLPKNVPGVGWGGSCRGGVGGVGWGGSCRGGVRWVMVGWGGGVM